MTFILKTGLQTSRCTWNKHLKKSDKAMEVSTFVCMENKKIRCFATSLKKFLFLFPIRKICGQINILNYYYFVINCHSNKNLKLLLKKLSVLLLKF